MCIREDPISLRCIRPVGFVPAPQKTQNVSEMRSSRVGSSGGGKVGATPAASRFSLCARAKPERLRSGAGSHSWWRGSSGERADTSHLREGRTVVRCGTQTHESGRRVVFSVAAQGAGGWRPTGTTRKKRRGQGRCPGGRCERIGYLEKVDTVGDTGGCYDNWECRPSVWGGRA